MGGIFQSPFKEQESDENTQILQADQLQFSQQRPVTTLLQLEWEADSSESVQSSICPPNVWYVLNCVSKTQRFYGYIEEQL